MPKKISVSSIKISVSAKNSEQKEMLRTISQSDITFVKGAPGSGKCINPDTSLLFTEDGLKLFAEMIPDTMASDQYYKIQVPLINRYGKFEVSKAIYKSGIRSTRKIITSRGYEIEGTHNHHILCLTEKGLTWKALSSLDTSDYACIQRKYHKLASATIKEREIAYFVGLMIGDGSYTLENQFSFSNIDRNIISYFCSFCEKNFDKKPTHSKSRTCDWVFCSKKARKQLKTWGLNCVKGKQKKIPERFLKTEAMQDLLRGLFDTDGYVEKSGQICFMNQSETLCRQIHLALLRLGMISSFRSVTKKYNNETRQYWKVSILLSHVHDFGDKIGFNVRNKQERLSFILSKTRNTNLDTIPNFYAKRILKDYYDRFDYTDRTKQNEFRIYTNSVKSPSYAKMASIYNRWKDKYFCESLSELISNEYFFDQIKSTSNQRSDVSDFVMSETHSFVANGFINHNTYLAVGFGLQALLREDYEQLIFTRPVIEAGGEKLGFLPGNMYEKIDPYMIPIFETLSKLLPLPTLNLLMPKNGNGNGNGNGLHQSPIRVLPLAYMRGVTFTKSFIICDEMQNSTPEQMRMLLTRLGEGSRMVLCGDVYQTDIGSANGLYDAFELLSGISGIGFVTLTQAAIMRHPVIQQIENRYLSRKPKKKNKH